MTPTPESIRTHLESALAIDAIVEALTPYKFRVWYRGTPSEQEVADCATREFTGLDFEAVDVAGLREIGSRIAEQGWRSREARQVEMRDGVLFDMVISDPLLTECVKWTGIPDGPVEVLLFVRRKS
jgi:hypothetical protein